MLKKNLSIAIVAIFVPIFFVGIVNSQTLERGGIEEIIVTAQKTDENIQDVPIAISAFSTESLELQQIETFGDLQFNAPNITFTKSNFTGANMTIRGVNSGTVGDTLSSIIVDSTNLIASSIPYTDNNTTAAAIRTAINNRTGTTNFTATGSGSQIVINKASAPSNSNISLRTP